MRFTILRSLQLNKNRIERTYVRTKHKGEFYFWSEKSKVLTHLCYHGGYYRRSIVSIRRSTHKEFVGAIPFFQGMFLESWLHITHRYQNFDPNVSTALI